MGKAIKKVVIIAVACLAVLILFGSTAYTVHPNESAIVIRLGRIQNIQSKTGLHFRVPFIDTVNTVYTGDILYDIPTSDVITSDKKSMIADDYVVWTITDPKKYYQTLGAIRGRAEERIEAAVYNATKNTISSMKQDDIIAARGNTLTNLITEASNSDITQYGIEIKIAEIKALDLPDDNKEAVYERMISERNNIAASYTAKGEAEAKKIMNETDKEVSITVANAKAEAAKIEAEGEAEYMRILSDAYNDEGKADFYNFIRGLDSLKALAGEDKTLILDKNSELARLLYGMN
ncbi:MAG: protease modulator HflC [Lachnospiraceae bacterium]|nr:protease modulator HflC [Lachnospiraceae bacterium]